MDLVALRSRPPRTTDLLRQLGIATTLTPFSLTEPGAAYDQTHPGSNWPHLPNDHCACRLRHRPASVECRRGKGGHDPDLQVCSRRAPSELASVHGGHRLGSP